MDCKHDWRVESKQMDKDGVRHIMLCCFECPAQGIVIDPDHDEWAKAWRIFGRWRGRVALIKSE